MHVHRHAVWTGHDSVHKSELPASSFPPPSRSLNKSHNRSTTPCTLSPRSTQPPRRPPTRTSRTALGFRRATYVDRAMGSVHMGTGICFLDPNGAIQLHLHSFEESFYILEGTVLVQIGDKTYTLGPGNFGLIPTGVPHSWRKNAGAPARWLEMQAPQPRSIEYGRDTFFTSNAPAPDAARADRPLRRIATAPPRRRVADGRFQSRPPALRSRCLSIVRSAPPTNRCS